MCASTKVTSLIYDQIFNLSVKLSKVNDKLEKSIVDFKEYIEFLENRNEIICEEITSIRNESLK